jgi:predicted transposase/invertase (TIGR01784 family)
MTLSVKMDLLFKRAFANAAYPEVPKHFIEDVLGLSVQDITIENPYSIDEFTNKDGESDMRHTEVDVLLRLTDQRLIVVELQRASQTFFIERSIFYATSRYDADYGRGDLQRTLSDKGAEKYSSLYPVYGINIVDFTLFNQDRRALRHFTFTDTETKELLNAEGMIHICYIELRKKAPRHLRHWMDFLNDKPMHTDAPDYIRQAYELVSHANLDDKERKMISAKERYEQDLLGQMNYVRNEGRNEGIALGERRGEQRGIAKGRNEGIALGEQRGIAKGEAKLIGTMLANGTSITEASRLTGLSVEEINRLLK